MGGALSPPQNSSSPGRGAHKRGRGRSHAERRFPSEPTATPEQLAPTDGCEGGFAAPLPAAIVPPIRAPVSPAAAPPFRHPQERRVPRSVPIAAAQEARSRARRTGATAPSFHRTAHSDGRSARHAQVSRRPSPPRSAPRPACRLPRETTSRRRSVESCPQSACSHMGAERSVCPCRSAPQRCRGAGERARAQHAHSHVRRDGLACTRGRS